MSLPVLDAAQGPIDRAGRTAARTGASVIKCCYAAAGSGTGAEETGLRAPVSRKNLDLRSQRNHCRQEDVSKGGAVAWSDRPRHVQK